MTSSWWVIRRARPSDSSWVRVRFIFSTLAVSHGGSWICLSAAMPADAAEEDRLGLSDTLRAAAEQAGRGHEAPGDDVGIRLRLQLRYQHLGYA